MRDAFATGTQIHVALDARERPLHCHHEKLVIVDGSVAFVGGIDLTTYAGDRLDSSDHPARGSLGWHDAATRITGPAVADVSSPLSGPLARGHRRATSRSRQPRPRPARRSCRSSAPCPRRSTTRSRGASSRSSSRTSPLSARRSGSSTSRTSSSGRPNRRRYSPTSSGIHPTSDSASSCCCPQSQTAEPTIRAANSGGSRTPAPAAPERFLACTLHQCGDDAEPVYVHAKIGLVDDRWLTIGSANLNEHSLFNDTEMNVVCADPTIARAARLRLWSEHLECSADDVAGDPADIIDSRWRPIAKEQFELRRQGRPCTHRLHALPHVSRRADALRGPLNGLLVDG